MSDTPEAWFSVKLVEAPGELFSAWMKIAVKPAVTSSAEGISPSSSRFRGLSTISRVSVAPVAHAGAGTPTGSLTFRASAVMSARLPVPALPVL